MKRSASVGRVARLSTLLVGVALPVACGGRVVTGDDAPDGGIFAAGGEAGEGNGGSGNGGDDGGGGGGASGGAFAGSGTGGVATAGTSGAPGAGGVALGGAPGLGGAGGFGGAENQAACEDEPDAVEGTAMVYDLGAAAAADPASKSFFDFPWPELGRGNDELVGFPNPADATGCDVDVTGSIASVVVSAIAAEDYRDYVTELVRAHLPAAPNAGAVYFRFDGPLRQESVPEVSSTLTSSTSPVLIVTMDDDGLAHRVPVSARIYESSRYLEPNTLALMPAVGFPLAPGRRHAAVVLRTFGAADGSLLGSPQPFEALKRPGACDARHAAYAPVFDALEDIGVPRSDIAAMSVFDTGRPTETLQRVAERVTAYESPAQLAALRVSAVAGPTDGYYTVSGALEMPLHQRESAPHLPAIETTTGGELLVPLDATDPAGAFIDADLPASASGTDTSAPRTEPVDFQLFVPESSLTGAVVEGLPLVVYGPGTGGGVSSPAADGIARDLAALGFSVLVTTPVMHGPRAHSENVDANLLQTLTLLDQLAGTAYAQDLITTVESGDLFFNPVNLVAARGNSAQMALEYMWLARVFGTAEVVASIGGETRTLSFDPDGISYFGHSQGAAIGPLLAHSREIGAVALSAPAGHVPTLLLYKSEPSGRLSIDNMLSYVACDDPSEPLGVHHPLLGLIGHWFEDVDAMHHASALTTGAFAKHTFALLGEQDSYSPPLSNHAMVNAARLQQAAPALVAVPGQALLDVLYPGEGYDAPATNLMQNLGGVTGAFRQYSAAGCADGHFVYACNVAARQDLSSYFQGVAAGLPVVP